MAAIKGRKDSKGYVLRTGESQRNDGRYCYAYSDRCGTEEKTGYGSRRDGKGKKLEKNRTTDFRTVSWKINEKSNPPAMLGRIE